jgi:hypothetical protein
VILLSLLVGAVVHCCTGKTDSCVTALVLTSWFACVASSTSADWTLSSTSIVVSLLVSCVRCVCVCGWVCVCVCAVKFKRIIRLVGERKALSRSPHLARGEKAICCSVRAPDKRGHRSETNEREPAQTACDSRQQGRVTEATHLRLWRVMRTVHSVKSDVHSKTRSVVRMTSISVCCAAHTSTPPLIPTIHCTSLPNAPPYKRLGSTSCTKERGDGASEASVSFASTKTPVF